MRGGEPLPRTRGMIGSRISSVYGKAPMRQLHGDPIAVSGSGLTGKQVNSFDAVIDTEESPHHNLLGCRSPFVRLAEHLKALSALAA